jgi:hypothetical protein
MSNPLKSEVVSALGNAIENVLTGSGEDKASCKAVAKKALPDLGEDEGVELCNLAVRAGWVGPYKLAQGKGIVRSDYTGPVRTPEEKAKELARLEKRLAKLRQS